MWTSALFVAKNIDVFLNLWCVCMDRGERIWANVDIVLDKGGQFFTILCKLPLWTPTAPEQKTAKLSIGYRPIYQQFYHDHYDLVVTWWQSWVCESYLV